jgi:hypothetical protein
MHIPFGDGDGYSYSPAQQKRMARLRKAWEEYYKNWNGSLRRRDHIISEKIRNGKYCQSKNIV